MKKIQWLASTVLFFFLFSLQTTAQQRKRVDDFGSKPFVYFPRDKNHRPPFATRSPNRSYDGTNNNIDPRKRDWGATEIPLFRELPAEYGPSDPKNAMGGTTRPSARQISNAVIDEPVTTFNERGLSTFVYVWGQFLDHDISLTPTGTTEYVPVPLPPDEVIFTEAIPFFRSEVVPGSGVSSPRDQMNLNTAWIDGSGVYGSDSVRARWLRLFKNGKMKVSTGNFLPYNTTTGELSAPVDVTAPSMANDSDHTVKTFVAGDIRAAEHPGILSLHTLFVREHNKICDRLMLEGFRNDEEIYQRARKEIAALIQQVTYEEFLPAIGIKLNAYLGYNPNARPDLANTFATAAYRIGHTMVADDILLRTNNCEEVEPGELDLVDAFWVPSLVVKYNLEPFLKGFAAHTQYETDTKINSVLRNFLFVSPNNPVRFGIDLGSLNIQRGRDHGLPNYNAVRKYYTGAAATSFLQVTSKPALADSLKKLYGTPDNMDLWIGILAEDHVAGKSVGNTIHQMLKKQFENLRDGDFYFYKNDPYLPFLTRFRLSRTKFSDVIKRNTSLTNLQSNVFFTEECLGDSALDEESISKLRDVKVFPNPASTSVTIDLGNAEGQSIIKIYNVSGILVKAVNAGSKQTMLQVDISALPSGMYIVNIANDKAVKSFKIMKTGN